MTDDGMRELFLPFFFTFSFHFLRGKDLENKGNAVNNLLTSIAADHTYYVPQPLKPMNPMLWHGLSPGMGIATFTSARPVWLLQLGECVRYTKRFSTFAF